MAYVLPSDFLLLILCAGYTGVCQPVMASRVVSMASVWHPIFVIVNLATLGIDVQTAVFAMGQVNVETIRQMDLLIVTASITLR